MRRRDFLRYVLYAPMAAAASAYVNPLRSIMGLAAENSKKTLIVIFQRGGCDGLNTIVPYGEDEYYKLRPDIAINPPSKAQGALKLDHFFGMHPALSPLYRVYKQGRVAILPAVHYSNASRSHFVSQDYIESGVPKVLQDGWLNRFLAATPNEALLRAIGFGTQTAHALRGEVAVSTISDLSMFSFTDDDFLKKLEDVYSQPCMPGKKYGSLLGKNGTVMLDNLKILSQIDPENYVPANGAEYPSSPFGKQLRHVAQLTKESLGLQVATVDINGWDTHINQGGVEGIHAERLSDFADGVFALYTDLGATLMDDVLILTMTEFGRTPKNNASLGTDHGNASSWFVIGNNVNGGIYGEWPGLQEENLYLQRYLSHNIDYSDVLGEVIDRHFGNSDSMPTVLPGHGYQPVGFL